MSQQHPAIKTYRAAAVPAETEVVSAWLLSKTVQEETQPVALTMEDAAQLICLAMVAEHWNFLFDHLLPEALEMDACNPQVWNLLLSLFPLRESEGIQPFREFLERLEREFRLSERWVVPNREGMSAWDEFLKDARGRGVGEQDSVFNQSRLVVLAELLEKLPSEFLDADHPLHPGLSRKDVWLWGWCAFPMASHRLHHLQHLLARGANPSVSMETESGKMGVGSALIWARFPSRILPVPSGQKETWETLDNLWERASCQGLSSPPKWWEKKQDSLWIRCDGPTPPAVFWAALTLLKHAGMVPARLEEPSWWGAPLLGLLSHAKKNITDGHWSPELIEQEWSKLTNMGFALVHPHQSDRSILSVVLKEQPSVDTPAKTYWLPNHLVQEEHWKQALNKTALDEFCHGAHGINLLLEEPRLLAQLLVRFTELAQAKNLTKLIAPSLVEHPLSTLGSCIEEAIKAAPWLWIARAVTAVAEFLCHTRALGISHAPTMPSSAEALVLGFELEQWRLTAQAIPSPELLSKIYSWAQMPLIYESQRKPMESPLPEDEFSHYSPMEAQALRQEKEKGREDLEGGSILDERPLTLLYSEKSSRFFLDWAETRKGEDIVKSWMGKIHHKVIKTGGVTTESMPSTARRLAKATPALAAMAKLRQAFPHFSDVVDLIDRHLLLESRGRGVFSLPPLLMSGPPGTGKTFFFQELAGYVDTSYTMLSMESVTGGFSIVGLDYGWGTSNPGLVFESLMKPGNTANPILLLDEIDKAPHSETSPVTPVLLPLLEPHSARRFRDRCIPLDIDASHVCWVATANDLERVSLPLKSRFTVLHVPSPDFNARSAMAAHIYAALRKANGWGSSFDEVLPKETLQVLVRPTGSARDLRKNISEAFAKAAQQQRNRIEPQDVPVQKSNAILAPWDAPLEEAEASEGVAA